MLTIRQRDSDRSAQQRRRISTQFQRLHKTVERAVIRSQRRFWTNVVIPDVMARVRDHGHFLLLVESVWEPRRYHEAFNDSMRRFWVGSVFRGADFEQAWIEQVNASRALQSLRMPMIRQHTLPNIGVQLTPESQAQLAKYLREREAGVWSSVSATTRKALERSVKAGIVAGETYDQMAQRIGKGLKGYSGWQARRIAATETTAGLNSGQQFAREDADIGSKEWVSTIDARVRGLKPGDQFDHLRPDGQVVDNSGAFVVSGERLRFPADGSLGASAGNVVNCRCAAVAAFDDGPVKPPPPPPPPKPGPKPKLKPTIKPPIPKPVSIVDVVPQPKLPPANWPDPPEIEFTEFPGFTDEENMEVYLQMQRGRRLQIDPQTKQAVDDFREVMAEHDAEITEVIEPIVRLQGAMDDLNATADDLRTLHKAATADHQAALASGDKSLIAETNRRVNELFDRRVAVQERIQARMAEVRAQVLDALRAPKGSKFVVEVVGDVPETTVQNTKTAAGWLKQVLSDAHQPAPDTPIKFGLRLDDADRAFYSRGTINMSEFAGVSTHVHEISHYLEDLSRKNLHHARGFMFDRIGGRRIESIKALRGDGFAAHEVGWSGNWESAFGKSAHYVGKYYGTYTETISMGLEMLYKDPLRLVENDVPYLKYLVAFLRGYFL